MATTTTKERTTTKTEAPTTAEQAKKGEVQILTPLRLPHAPSIEERFGIDRTGWNTLINVIFPSAASTDSVCMALAYCRQRKLDIFKRPVHIVPMWSSLQNKMVDTIWPGISELRTTAHRTGGYAGMDEIELGEMVTYDFEGKSSRGQGRGTTRKCSVEFPRYAKAVVYRIVGGQRCPFHGPKVYWLEAYAQWADTTVPNEMWQERPIGQLQKCAEAAALRAAFPEELGNDLTAEEMMGRRLDESIETTASGDSIPPAVAAPSASTAVTTRDPVERSQQQAADTEKEFRSRIEQQADQRQPPGDASERSTADMINGDDPMLGKLRAALIACKSEDDLGAALDKWLEEAGDLTPRQEEVVENMVEATRARFKAPPADPVAEREAEQRADATAPKGKKGGSRKAAAKATEKPASAANENADQGAGKSDDAHGAPPPAGEATIPADFNLEAAKTSLRVCKTLDALAAAWENLQVHKPNVPEDDWTALDFVHNQRIKLITMAGKRD